MITYIAIGGPVLIFVFAIFDLWCLMTGRLTPGEEVQAFTRAHPFYGAFFIGFVGAFAAHIYWHS